MSCYLVGTDIGTTGTKTVLIDTDGNILAHSFQDYPLITNYMGYAEQEPELYWEAACKTISEVILNSKINPKKIQGIAISGLSPACIMINRQLEPLQLAHIWMDRRSTLQCQWLIDNIGQERIFNISANPIDPYYSLTKLMWERDNRPLLYKEAFKMLSAADYPVMKLTGVAVTDYSNASLYGIAFNIRKKTWDEQLIRDIKIDINKLPEVLPCEEIAGYVTKEASTKTLLPAGTPVLAGTVDCNAAWVGAGAIQEGDTSIAMGTTGVIGVVHKQEKFSRKMITIVHAANSRETYTTLSAQLCGAIYKYFRDNFINDRTNNSGNDEADTFKVMDLEAQNINPGSDGLILLPYFQGERTPVWDPLARGLIFGINLNHTRGHLIRAVMEGVGYAFRDNFNIIKKSGIKMTLPIVMIEGGAKSKLWRQIVCDMLEVPGAYLKNSSGAPFGSAILAGVGTDVFKDFNIVKKLNEIRDITEPDKNTAGVYKKYFRIFQKLYKNNKSLFKDLAAVKSEL